MIRPDDTLLGAPGSPAELRQMDELAARRQRRADDLKAAMLASLERTAELYLAAQEAAAADAGGPPGTPGGAAAPTPASATTSMLDTYAQGAPDAPEARPAPAEATGPMTPAINNHDTHVRPSPLSSGGGSAQMRIDEVAAAARRRQGNARPYDTSPPRFDSEAGHERADAEPGQRSPEHGVTGGESPASLLSPRRAEPENALLRAGPSGAPDGTSASPSATRAAAPQACAAPRRTARGPRVRDNGVTTGRDPRLVRLAWSLAWAVVRAELEHRRTAPPAWRPR